MIHMILPLENQDLSLLDICLVGATFLFAFFPLEVSDTIPFGLFRFAEQLMPCSALVDASARLRLFSNTVLAAPFKIDKLEQSIKDLNAEMEGASKSKPEDDKPCDEPV
ncbi:hypothetical protein BHM03_00015242 [Ensete ventricosum]|nr:hypothetical protein BHM03_00015242 [Ensete ventricosum]